MRRRSGMVDLNFPPKIHFSRHGWLSRISFGDLESLSALRSPLRKVFLKRFPFRYSVLVAQLAYISAHHELTNKLSTYGSQIRALCVWFPDLYPFVSNPSLHRRSPATMMEIPSLSTLPRRAHVLILTLRLETRSLYFSSPFDPCFFLAPTIVIIPVHSSRGLPYHFRDCYSFPYQRWWPISHTPD